MYVDTCIESVYKQRDDGINWRSQAPTKPHQSTMLFYLNTQDQLLELVKSGLYYTT